jgi:hypothetical protein
MPIAAGKEDSISFFDATPWWSRWSHQAAASQHAILLHALGEGHSIWLFPASTGLRLAKKPTVRLKKEQTGAEAEV